jgi:rare lipoprotein A (peptidoglycan hydrolase)
MNRSTHKLMLLALVSVPGALFVGVTAASAGGGSGGVGTGGSTGGGKGGSGHKAKCKNQRFGSRTLSKGDCGSDVKTLNWMLRAKASKVDLDKSYKRTTASAVRSFERNRGLRVNGVVEKSTREALTKSIGTAHATWYGPTLYGNGVACGGTLRPTTIGVAHKTLPCGTKVLVGYRGHWVRTKVIDRGPYGTGAQYDLTEATAKRLHFKNTGFGTIKVARIRKH